MPLIYNLSYLLKILESLVFILSPNIQWKFQLIYIFSNIETETKIPLPSKVLLLLLFSQQVMSASLQLHDCSTPGFPTLSPGVCSNSCLLSRWCYLTISSSANLFSICLQSFPASGSFPRSWLFPSGGQSIGASASASVLQMNTQELISFRIDWLDLLAVRGTLKSLLQHHNLKASILNC